MPIRKSWMKQLRCADDEAVWIVRRYTMCPRDCTLGLFNHLATDAGREQEYRATACHRRIPDSCTDVPATDEIHVPPLCNRQALGVFDDMYNPEYAIEDLIEEFCKLAKQGKLPESVNTYLHEAWKEIKEMESCTDYGVPRREPPF